MHALGFPEDARFFYFYYENNLRREENLIDHIINIKNINALLTIKRWRLRRYSLGRLMIGLNNKIDFQ